MTGRKKGILISIAIAAVLLITVIMVLLPMIEFILDGDALRQYIRSRGFPAVLLFMLMCILQILSTIVPAGPFEIAAGSAFGVIPGTILCDIAMTCGSSLAFFLSRKFGRRFVSLFYSEDQMDELEIPASSKKMAWMSFVFYLIPGLPKDILAYLLGMTDIPLPVFSLIVFVGRIPSILLTAIGGDALVYQRKEQFIGFAAVSILFYILGILALRKYRKKHSGQVHR